MDSQSTVWSVDSAVHRTKRPNICTGAQVVLTVADSNGDTGGEPPNLYTIGRMCSLHPNLETLNDRSFSGRYRLVLAVSPYCQRHLGRKCYWRYSDL